MLHPLREANAYQKLIDSGRHDVQSLTVQFGKTEAYIRTRLKFVSLIPEIALLLEQDELTISVATEICRYGEDIQHDIYDKHLREGLTFNSWRGMKASEVAKTSNEAIRLTSIVIRLTRPYAFRVPTTPIT